MRICFYYSSEREKFVECTLKVNRTILFMALKTFKQNKEIYLKDNNIQKKRLFFCDLWQIHKPKRERILKDKKQDKLYIEEHFSFISNNWPLTISSSLFSMYFPKSLATHLHLACNSSIKICIRSWPLIIPFFICDVVL